MTPGIYDIPAADYHADALAPEPSLSNSILRTLLTKSPAHARLKHPRLNPDYAPYEAEKFDLGTAAHGLLLEGVDRTVVVEKDDWRTKEAKEQREAARARGLTPMLRHQYDGALEMVGAAREFIKRTPILRDAFSTGKPEQTVLWQEGNVWCRGLLDWLTGDRGLIIDFKTTSAENPDAFMRGMVGYGYDSQDAMYRRGLMALGHSPEFLFLVQEDSPPFSCYIVQCGESMRALGESKVKRGIELWGTCMAANAWPDYERPIYDAAAPAWALMQEEVTL